MPLRANMSITLAFVEVLVKGRGERYSTYRSVHDCPAKHQSRS